MSEKIYFNTEGFELKNEKLSDGSESIILEGVAMPLNKMSRNKVVYRSESIKKAYKTMEGAAFLFNHNTNISLGHVEDVQLDEGEEVMKYRANMDPHETEFVNKVKRQDIRHVSVGCLIDNVEYDEEAGIATCDVEEFVELSLVPVPGFKDATANINGEFLEATPLLLAEKFGNKEMIKKLKEKKELEDKDKEETKEEAEDDSIEEKVSVISARVEELFSKFDEVVNRLSIIEANMDAMNDSEEEIQKKELSPDTEENFKDDKITIKSKENIVAKEKALFGEKSKKIKEGKKLVDMSAVRMKNLSY